MEIALVNTVAPGEKRPRDLARLLRRPLRRPGLRLRRQGRRSPVGVGPCRPAGGGVEAARLRELRGGDDHARRYVDRDRLARRGLLRPPPRARRTRDPGRRLRDGGHRRAVRPVGRRRPPDGRAEGDRRASRARALPLLAAGAGPSAVVPDRPRLLRGHPPLAPHHGGPGPLLRDAVRQRDRRARRGAPDDPRGRASGPLRAARADRTGDPRRPRGPRPVVRDGARLPRRDALGRVPPEGGRGRGLPEGGGRARRRRRGVPRAARREGVPPRPHGEHRAGRGGEDARSDRGEPPDAGRSPCRPAPPSAPRRSTSPEWAFGRSRGT